jgi:hypothetical protein
VSEPVVRALTASDGAAARALVHAAYDGTRYLARTLELLDLALSGRDLESVGVVSTTDGVVDAVLLHGSLAGAMAVQRLHVLLGRVAVTGPFLIDVLCRETGWRMIVCELAEESCHATTASVLAARGFTREASVAAYFDDDTDLVLYVLRRGAAER